MRFQIKVQADQEDMIGDYNQTIEQMDELKSRLSAKESKIKSLESRTRVFESI